MRHQTAAERRPVYRAVADGLGAGYDSDYQPTPPQDEFARQMLEETKAAVQQLSDLDKMRLAMFLQEAFRTRRAGEEKAETYEQFDAQPAGRRVANWAMSEFEADDRFMRE